MEPYRDREIPYVHPPKDAAWISYFTTHAPGEWKNNPGARDSYFRIYGRDALATLDNRGLVCENHNPVWVAGTNLDERPFWPELAQPTPMPAVDPITAAAGEPVAKSLSRLERKIDALLREANINPTGF
jgi:hypothetical protein